LSAREIENIFADIVDRAKVLDPVNTRKWFEKLTVLRLSGGLLEIGCPDDATAEFLRDNCKKSFTQAAQQITGHLVSVEFKFRQKIFWSAWALRA
jgi:chromosomal replication initiator protein